jgi:mannose-6-phosphate isomerase-like protein (cupin superfamily)
MADFPAFMKNRANLIPTTAQFTDDIEGYVFDGVDGSQVAFWHCARDRESVVHAHDFDEYVLVVEGQATVHMNGTKTVLDAGQELVVPRGTSQSMAVLAGTRTIHVFGGTRVRRSV